MDILDRVRIDSDLKEKVFSVCDMEVVNCPCFFDFLIEDLYHDDILLVRYLDAVEQDYKTDFALTDCLIARPMMPSIRKKAGL